MKCFFANPRYPSRNIFLYLSDRILKKHVLMTALTYNLKKYLKFIVKKNNTNPVYSSKQEKVRACLKTCFKDLKIDFLRDYTFLNPDLQ